MVPGNPVRSALVKFAALALFCALSPLFAQHHGPGPAGSSGPVDLGEISFPTSGPPEAQKHFIEGVLLLHSFEYDRAQRAFSEAQRAAPDFAMAYWGEAMSYSHPIWGEQYRSRALAALAKLAPTPAERRAKAPTERERMYLDAVEKLYVDGEEHEIAAAYSDAMGQLVKRFPDDLEAQAFYSLSILGLTGTVRNTANYMRAARIAEAVNAKNPRHPGALHYIIHAYDDPEHAALGLKAARAYGSVARGASHAQHMPSHIFFALGLWDDAIVANTASMKTARDQGTGGYHPLHWLEHAYLQVGREEEAAKLVGIVEDDVRRSPSQYARSHLAACRATFLVEAEGKGPASMMETVDSSGIVSKGVFLGHDLAIGLEYVRRKEMGSARRILERMGGQQAAVKAATASANDRDRYSNMPQSEIDAVYIMERMLGSRIEFENGDRDSAIRQAVAAAEAEDKLVFEYGPPAIVKPAWELVGDMLLEAGRKKDAADAYRKALKRYPNRRLSKRGLAAAER